MNVPRIGTARLTTYTGHARRHDYSVTIRHSAWRTKVLALTIDGVERLSDGSPEMNPDAEIAANGVETRVRGWSSVRVVIRRPTVEGKMGDHEEIHASSSILGGAGEVEVHSGSEIVPLLPERGSRSEERDLKRTAHPTRFALLAALTTALRLVIPLLGLGALLALLAEPAKAWLSRHLTPLLDPIFHWLGRVLEPLGSALGAVGRFFGSIIDFLFGWIPAIRLPFDTPDWVWTTAKITLFALLAFTANRSNLKRRSRHLEQSKSGSNDEGECREQLRRSQ